MAIPLLKYGSATLLGARIGYGLVVASATLNPITTVALTAIVSVGILLEASSKSSSSNEFTERVIEDIGIVSLFLVGGIAWGFCSASCLNGILDWKKSAYSYQTKVDHAQKLTRNLLKDERFPEPKKIEFTSDGYFQAFWDKSEVNPLNFFNKNLFIIEKQQFDGFKTKAIQTQTQTQTQFNRPGVKPVQTTIETKIEEPVYRFFIGFKEKLTGWTPPTTFPGIKIDEGDILGSFMGTALLAGFLFIMSSIVIDESKRRSKSSF